MELYTWASESLPSGYNPNNHLLPGYIVDMNFALKSC